MSTIDALVLGSRLLLAGVFVVGGSLDGGDLAIAAAAIALLAGGAVAFVLLLQSHGRLLLRVEELEQTLAGAGAGPELGLELGTPAPMFAGLDDLLARGAPLLLLFVSPQCDACRALLPEAVDWQVDHAGRLTVAVASQGAPDDVRAEAHALALDHVLVDEGAELFKAFEAEVTPSAVLIAPDGVIASRVASGPDAIEAMVADVLDTRGVPIGTPVPALEVPPTQFSGESSSVSSFSPGWRPR